jgi:hypothetical protein
MEPLNLLPLQAPTDAFPLVHFSRRGTGLVLQL